MTDCFFFGLIVGATVAGVGFGALGLYLYGAKR